VEVREKVEAMDRSSASTRAYPPPLVAWWGCAVLTMGCILGFADRGVLNLFIIPIQRDLHLTDTQISLVIGLAFGVFNALFGLPAGRWIDRGARTRICALGISAWSLATAACGLASNFPQLFAARVAVGVGEATVTPCGVSLLADLFPPQRRGLPVGIFYGGLFVGGGGALVVGGILWRVLGDRLIALPLVGSVHSWQVILMLIAALGAIVAPLTLTLREPPRLDGRGQVQAAGAPFSEVLAFYRHHAGTLLGHNGGFCLFNFALHAASAWIPTLVVRTYGWSLPQAGATFGTMMLLLGPAGSASSGALADFLGKRGRTDAKFIICIGAAIVLIGLSVALSNHLPMPMLYLVLAGFAFFGTFSFPLAAGSLQEIMPNAMRGQAIAVYVAVTNIIAGSLAATGVALLTDYVFHDPAMLRLSFGIVAATACALAAIVLASTLSSYRSTVSTFQSSTRTLQTLAVDEAAAVPVK
jgi:MFS family permease